MSEEQEVKRDGAKAQKNSGRGKVAKGDAILDGHWVVDYKEYPKGFTVSKEAWAKICTDAMRAGGYEPALKIILGEGTQKVRLFVISEDEMNEYRALRREQERKRQVHEESMSRAAAVAREINSNTPRGMI